MKYNVQIDNSIYYYFRNESTTTLRTRFKHYDSMSRALLGLHWLPVDKRIEFCALVVMYKARSVYGQQN